MRTLIGEMVFGIGISTLAGAIVLMWQYLGEIIVDMKWFYLGVLICVGIALIIIGAVRINNYSKTK